MGRKAIRAAKILRQQEILNTVKQEKRDLTTEEQAEFDSLQREIDDLNREIGAEEKEPGGEPAPPENTRQLVDEALQAERQRSAEITTLCREFGMEPDKFITEGKTLDETRAAVLEYLKKNGAPLGSRIAVGESGEDEFRRDASDGLVMRGGLTPTAAFPSILDNAIEKSYVAGYKQVPVTFDKWTRKGKQTRLSVP